MEKLELYIPKLEDLWFYQQMTSDPETMSYNANWDVDYDGYHRDTGCIDHPDEVLPGWYENMIGHEPERFYAYIKRCSDGAWIGDVNFHYTPEKDWWDMGIVMYAPFRGKGYAVPALSACGLDWAAVCRISAGLILPYLRAYTPIAYTAWRCPYDRGLTHQSQGAGCVHHRDPHHHPAGGKALRTFQIDRAQGPVGAAFAV